MRRLNGRHQLKIAYFASVISSVSTLLSVETHFRRLSCQAKQEMSCAALGEGALLVVYVEA
jgi:hypothetical protein